MRALAGQLLSFAFTKMDCCLAPSPTPPTRVSPTPRSASASRAITPLRQCGNCASARRHRHAHPTPDTATAVLSPALMGDSLWSPRRTSALCWASVPCIYFPLFPPSPLKDWKPYIFRANRASVPLVSQSVHRFFLPPLHVPVICLFPSCPYRFLLQALPRYWMCCSLHYSTKLLSLSPTRPPSTLLLSPSVFLQFLRLSYGPCLLVTLFPLSVSPYSLPTTTTRPSLSAPSHFTP